MTTRTSLSLGLLTLGAAAIGLAGQVTASDSDKIAKEATADATRAAQALTRRDASTAIARAEEAVAAAPRTAGYRMLLGQGYLQAGRFQSAAAAFTDVLALEPGNHRAALNLALAQVATGDWQAARRTIDANEGIPVADRGLAMALAGDPQGAVALLMTAAREPGATPKLRQNLALSLALSGQWQAARVVAQTDMSPADVDQRLAQWAEFAQPRSAYDQVASLLGVRPVNDPGQPVALALSAPMPVVAVAAPVMPVPVAEAVPPAPPMMAATVFAPRREVVQALPTPLIRADAKPARLALARASMTPGVQRMHVMRPASMPLSGEWPVKRLRALAIATKPAAPRAPASGNFYVQLGAYENAGVAKDAWSRFARRHAVFAGQTPSGAAVKANGSTLYRLSVGGFARGDADQFCRRYRANGGVCFVRAGAGDQMVRWAGPQRVQLASR
jgi:Flp pilus assembly protein TadD